MARIYKDAEGNVTGSSQSTSAGGCLGFLAFVILLLIVIGSAVGH